MTIKLYNNKSRANKINKVLEDEASFTGEFIESTNMEGPSFTLDMESTALNNYNYAYIVDFNKYYFIVSKTIEEANIIRLNLAPDVLMTYKAQLVNCPAIISRASKLWNLYLQDAGRQTQQNQNTYIKEFPNSLDSISFILITAGSYQNIQNT